MTDHDPITRDLVAAVREPFAGVRMATAAEAVTDRGRAIRRHRRQRVSAAAAAAAAAAALAIVAVLPAGRPAPFRPAPVRLAAWTVTTEPTGIVAVTIRDLRDPAGLQRALAAHGVPALVRFHHTGSLIPSCVTSVPSTLATIEHRVFVSPPAAGHGRSLLYIDPAAVPGTYKIAIDAIRGNGLSLGLLTHDGRCPPGSRPSGIGISSTPAGH
jgi:hypothetical protein